MAKVSFQAHIELLQAFLAQRAKIVVGIERLLNCQKKPVEHQQDFALLSRQFMDCFFAGLAADQASLRDQLEHAHWDSGFRPRANPGNDLVDPVEQMIRSFHMWRQTHWPGQKGRVRFAHTLFNLYLLRSLALLCMRLWDANNDGVAARLTQAQAVLDALWQSAPADQPRLVRDVRWLFPVAMSPTTDGLNGYFAVAQRIAETFTEDDRLETHRAWVQTGAGHLRSQLYHLAVRNSRAQAGAAPLQTQLALDENSLVLSTRMSNALDLALLVQGLVTLLDAYERCRVSDGDERKRLALAWAICQGISPDPELFVNRLDLLGPYSMIEHLFITTNEDGRAVYTAMGQRHLALLEQYAALMDRLAQPLYEDWQRSKSSADGYSPFGVLYGFASNLLELMAFKTLQRNAVLHFSMEDVFSDGDANKVAWVNAWRNLPHIKSEVVKQFEYPRQFVEAISARIDQALGGRVAGTAEDSAPDNPGVKNAASGHLFILSDAALQTAAPLAQIAGLPLRYIVSSDAQLVAAYKAEAKDQEDLLHCRLEGEFLVSYATAGGWFALTKDVLTDVLGTGRDAKLAGLPRAAAEVLGLMCPGLVVMPLFCASGRQETSTLL